LCECFCHFFLRFLCRDAALPHLYGYYCFKLNLLQSYSFFGNHGTECILYGM
jgi:hypothetical protein